MPSTFTWVDFSEHECRKALDVVDLFREKDTRDELGGPELEKTCAELRVDLTPG